MIKKKRETERLLDLAPAINHAPRVVARAVDSPEFALPSLHKPLVWGWHPVPRRSQKKNSPTKVNSKQDYAHTHRDHLGARRDGI